MRYKVVAAPELEPLSPAEARAHVRGDTETAPDAELSRLISTAREWVESFTGRWLAQQTIEVVGDGFGNKSRRELVYGYRHLPCWPDLDLGWPVQSIESIKYTDTAGVEQTLDPALYVPDTFSQPVRIDMAYGQTWPALRFQANAVRVRAIVGPTEDEPIPAALRSAMLLMIGHLFENRKEASDLQTFAVPMGIETLAWPFRVGLGV